MSRSAIFEIQAGHVVCYYNKLGVTRELQEMYSFGIIPGFHTPDWAKGAVMYQILWTASATEIRPTMC